MNKNNVFSITVRVYYEDTDAGGVVYHANYLKYMERARSEWLRQLGYEQDVLIKQQQLLFAVRRLSIDYIQPARFNDLLTITTTITKTAGASIEFCQQLSHQSVLLATAKVQVASLDALSLKPKRIPHSIKEELNRVHVC